MDPTYQWQELRGARHWLYNTLYALDQKRTQQWMELFFATTALQKRIDTVKKEVERKILSSHPKLVKYFNECLDDFSDIRTRRNTIAHGIWIKGDPKNGFEIQPLKFDRGATTLESSIMVDFNYLGDLNERIDRLLQKFGRIDAELIAHGYMEKIRERRRKLGMPER